MTEQTTISDQVTSSGTYLDHLLGSLASGGDREALVYGDQRITYAQAHEKSLRLAGALRGAGLRKGDGVAVFVGNRPESVLLQIATHLIGCRLVFVPPEPGQSELSAFIDLAGTKAFVFDPGFGGRAEELADQVSAAHKLSLGPSTVGTDLLALMEQAPAVLPDVEISKDDIVTLLYTGGGHVAAITGLLAGATVVLGGDFDAAQILGTMEREHITGLGLTPPMLYEILDHPACREGGFPALARIFYGGAPTAPARLREAIERFGPMMRQSYGLTEAPVITTLEPDQHDLERPETLRTCGRPLPGMAVEIRDEQGNAVPAGQIGEVHTQGFMVMTEFWGDPERTREELKEGRHRHRPHLGQRLLPAA